jgi:hypothetical protein
VKKLAVMQPYFFPYIGYFQLVHAVDEFVFLDDVSFIKGGYINRNSILLNGRAYRFTIPVQDVSSFRTIREHRYVDSLQKFQELLRHAYRRAPQFEAVSALIAELLAASDRSVAAINAASVEATFKYLGIDKPFFYSSTLDPDPELTGEARVIGLCENRHASVYINAAGGRALYDPARFAARGVALGFIEPRFPEYRQNASSFVAGLSMIDVLMWNSPEQVADMLGHYSVDCPVSLS